MSISQIIRTSSRSPGNPSGIMSDILSLNNSYSGTGPPPALIAGSVVGNTYIDNASGVEYKLQLDGTWQPFFDFTTIPVIVPDPLIINNLRADEVDCDTIRGKASDNIDVDVGGVGKFNVKETGGNKIIFDPLEGKIQADGGSGMTLTAIEVTQPVRIEAGTTSGNIQLVAGTSGFVDVKGASSRISTQENNTFLIDHRTPGEDVELKAEASAAGNVRLRPGLGGQVQCTENLSLQGKDLIDVANIQHTGATTFTMSGTLDQDIELKTDGTGKVSVVKNLGGQIDIDPQNNKISSNASPFTLSSGITNIESTGGSLNLKGSGLVNVNDLISGKAIVLDPTGTIAGNPDGPFVIQNVQNNQDLDIKTALNGQINFRSGTSNIVCHNPLVATTFGLTTSSINASQTYTEAKALIANGAGALVWSKLPETAIFTAVNVGANANRYLDVSSLSVNPADVPVYPVLQPNTKIRRLEACLMSSVPWNWGGVGDARIKLGYIADNLPCIDANFVSVFEFPINVTDPWYFTLAIPNVAVNASSHKLVCRLDASGTSATNTQAELIVKVTIAD